jgi:hypothetical protein
MKKTMRATWSAMRAAGPYVAIELIVPGGTLVAMVLWFARNRRAARALAAAEAQS